MEEERGRGRGEKGKDEKKCFYELNTLRNVNIQGGDVKLVLLNE